MRKIYFPFLAILLAIFGCNSASFAELLGDTLDFPKISYNSTGITEYDTDLGVFMVQATPLSILMSGTDRPISFLDLSGGSLSISVLVDNEGNLMGGVDGDDFVLQGTVDPGDGEISDVLLSGEVNAFGFHNSDGTTDTFDFSITLTGGRLQYLYNSNNIGIINTSEHSNFSGDFTEDFDGGAKGTIGGILCTGTIGDFVWQDLSKNGIQDGGEPGINGVTVSLYDSSQILITTTITNTNTDTGSDGWYQFTGLCGGEYIVEVDESSSALFNFQPTPKCSNNQNISNDSNADGAVYASADCTPVQTVVLTGDNTDNPTIDFGFVTPCTGTLGDFVWHDQDKDGSQDGGEPGINGVEVSLYYSGGDLITTTTTSSNDGSDGWYQFTGLCEGDYEVEVDQNTLPAGYEPTPFCSDSQSDPDDSNADGATVDCTPMQTVVLTGDNTDNPTIDFGFVTPCTGTIGDFVWHDRDKDGSQDGGEPGINGVEVSLYYSGGDLITTTTTSSNDGSDGWYQFTGLCEGDYEVEVDQNTLPAGYEPTSFCSDSQSDPDDSNADGATADCTPVQTVVLTGDNTDNPTIDFGFVTPCTGTIGDFVWHDQDKDGFQNGEPGINSVKVSLYDSQGNLITTTTTSSNAGSDGWYQFTGLCEGEYIVEVYEGSSALINFEPTPTCSSESVSQISPYDSDSNADGATADCTPVQTVNLFEDDADNPTIDFGFITPACTLDVIKTCFVPVTEKPEGLFDCDKPIDVLTMIWNGTDEVRIKAWKGNVGSTLLADINNIKTGQEVTVSGFAGSPNDVFWQIFYAEPNDLIDDLIGESKFHLSCSDAEMNGPEDCGEAEGNGKDNDTDFINDWLLEGIVDAKGTLDCNVDPISEEGTSECEFYTQEDTLCEKKPTAIMLSYLGGNCDDMTHSQDPSKVTCIDYYDDMTEPVRIVMSKDDGSNVNLDTDYPADVYFGDVVTAVAADGKSDFDSSSIVQIFDNDDVLLQEVIFHTSCSQPLAPGDIFGGVQVVGFENADQGLVQLGAEVEYKYVIKNIGDVDVFNLTVDDNKLGTVPGSPVSLEPDETITLTVNAFLEETTTNIVTVAGNTIIGNICSATDSATVTALGPPPCAVSSVEFKILDDKVEWKLSNDGDKVITIESIEIIWPEGLGDLKKVKREGDTIFEEFVSPSKDLLVISEDRLTTDLKKRQINPGDSNKVIFEFTNKALTYPEDYTITINFRESCSVQVVKSDPPLCTVSPVEFKISDDKVEWFLSNDGDRLVTIKSIDFTWPADPTDLTARQLKKVKREGDTIFETLVRPTNVLIGSDDYPLIIVDLNKRQIKPGDTNKIVFEFSSKAVTYPDNYGITVKFDEGCSVEFDPKDIPFVCGDVQPIDSLTMIWAGSEEISSIDVYMDKYDPNDTAKNFMYTSSGSIVNGDEFTATGYAEADAKNDVDWVITYVDTTIPQGISRFHRSCSDDNMDGADDCESLQGNSKDDTSGLVNEWLFEGMAGNGLTLDCTP